MSRLRAAFDPFEIANPGKMFPVSGAPSLQQHGLHPLEKAGVISRE
jgi:glycolate oxidase